jgi:transposase InsO family protein
MKFEFIEKHRGLYDVAEMCETLGVSTSGYYRRESSPPSLRQSEDESFKEKILGIHDQAVGDYGHRPVYRHLLEDGVACGRDRTLRLMNELEISGRQSKGYKPRGTDSSHDFGYSPNLLKELGATSRCDEVWVSDTTYLRAGRQWMYLATVMDLHSRRILGWSVSPTNAAALTLEALKAAVATRGLSAAGVIHHSDRGSTYASYAYRNYLFALGMKSSMSAKGNCYDNAAKESFYGRFKAGSVRERVFLDESELRRHVFLYIEMFYNRFRKHSSIEYKNPIQFERDFFAPHGGQSKERYLYQDQTN